MRKIILGIIIVIASSYWTIRPILAPGFFPMHDDTQVGRVVAMGNAIRNKQFPVRWVSDLGYGYGYPIFNFYGPLPYYIGGSFYALGLSALTATKLMFILGIMLAGIAMYLATFQALGSLGAVIASIFYLYAPYHAVQVYVRGAVDEFWVLVFLPLVFFGFWQSRQDSKKTLSVLIGGIGLSGVILSHTVLGYVVVLGVVAGVAIYWLWQREKITHFLELLAIGLGLSAFFWLPALFEMRYTNVVAQIGPTANFMDHFVCVSQLWNSPWGYGGSSPGCLDGMSFKLGKLHLIIALGALLLLVNKRRRFSSFVMFGLGIALVAIFFTLPISAALWNILPQFAYVQYPWRFLTFAIFGLSIVAASILLSFSKLLRLVFGLVFGFWVIFTNAKLFMPQYFYLKEAAAFETPEELRWRVSKISDEYLPPTVPRPQNQYRVAGAAISPTISLDVETEINRETYMKFQLMSKFEQAITLYRAYFPGWRYWVNGQEAMPIIIDGLPNVVIPQGKSVVEVRFTNTPVRTLGNIISAVSLFLVIYFYGKKTYA